MSFFGFEYLYNHVENIPMSLCKAGISITVTIITKIQAQKLVNKLYLSIFSAKIKSHKLGIKKIADVTIPGT